MATKILRVKPTCHDGTTAATGAVIANPTKLEGAVFALGGSAKVVNVSIHDANDNATKPITAYFFQKDTNDLGTLGSAANISGADFSANIPFGPVAVPGVGPTKSGDLNNSVQMTGDASVGIKAAYGSTDIYLGLVANLSGFVSTPAGLEVIITVEA